MKTRSDNFQQRVFVERRVLQAVNKYGGCAEPLAGLTKPAIQQWAKQTSAQMEEGAVLSLLVEISARLNVEADKSKQVFDSSPVPSSLAELANKLELLLTA